MLFNGRSVATRLKKHAGSPTPSQIYLQGPVIRFRHSATRHSILRLTRGSDTRHSAQLTGGQNQAISVRDREGVKYVKRTLLLLSFMAVLTNSLLRIVEAAEKSDAPRPHIVYIVADDLGWKDVGFHGSDI